MGWRPRPNKVLDDVFVLTTTTQTADLLWQVKANRSKRSGRCPVCHMGLPAQHEEDDAVTVRRRGNQLVLDVANRPALEWLVKNKLPELLDSMEADNGDDHVLSRNQAGIEAPDPRKAKNTFEFVELMNALVDWANPPSLRQLASRVPDLPRSTLSETLNRPDRMPKQELLRALVKACRAEADWPKWYQTRERLKDEEKTRRRLARYAAPIPQDMMRKMNLDDLK